MASTVEGSQPPQLPPEEAFSALGDATRVEILQTLGKADEPLSFSELRNRVGLDRGEQFNYHLDKLVGHFVRKATDGYSLRAPGRRIIKAVLSGAVAESPVMEQTEIEADCQLCGAAIEVRYHREAVETYCTTCHGMWQRERQTGNGYLGRKLLPPAGTDDRSPAELYRAAWTWTNLHFFAIASDICPSCSAGLVFTVAVCEDHQPGVEPCSECGNRYAAKLSVSCGNCILDLSGSLPIALSCNTAMLDFLTDHGLNPVSPDSIAAVQRVFSEFDEEIRSVEPFEAEYTFNIEDDAITLTVDADLNVIDVGT